MKYFGSMWSFFFYILKTNCNSVQGLFKTILDFHQKMHTYYKYKKIEEKIWLQGLQIEAF